MRDREQFKAYVYAKANAAQTQRQKMRRLAFGGVAAFCVCVCVGSALLFRSGDYFAPLTKDEISCFATFEAADEKTEIVYTNSAETDLTDGLFDYACGSSLENAEETIEETAPAGSLVTDYAKKDATIDKEQILYSDKSDGSSISNRPSDAARCEVVKNEGDMAEKDAAGKVGVRIIAYFMSKPTISNVTVNCNDEVITIKVFADQTPNTYGSYVYYATELLDANRYAGQPIEIVFETLSEMTEVPLTAKSTETDAITTPLAENKSEANKSCEFVKSVLDGEYTVDGVPIIEERNGFTYVNGVLIVNKSYSMPKDFDPAGIAPEAQAAFDEMKAAALEDGIKLRIISGYRPYSQQDSAYRNYVARDGIDAAERYSARPGHSEHQTGLAMDLNSLSSNFGNTEEGKWIAAHCAEYGFILRYPQGKEEETGYMYEPWHIRYLNIELARAITKSGLSLEEYLGIQSVYPAE